MNSNGKLIGIMMIDQNDEVKKKNMKNNPIDSKVLVLIMALTYSSGSWNIPACLSFSLSPGIPLAMYEYSIFSQYIRQ